LVLTVYPHSGPDQILGASFSRGGHGGNFMWVDAKNLISIVGGEKIIWLLIHSNFIEKCIA